MSTFGGLRKKSRVRHDAVVAAMSVIAKQKGRANSDIFPRPIFKIEHVNKLKDLLASRRLQTFQQSLSKNSAWCTGGASTVSEPCKGMTDSTNKEGESATAGFGNK